MDETKPPSPPEPTPPSSASTTVPLATPVPKAESATGMRSRLIREIRAHHHFRVDDAHELWVWSGGTWIPAPESWTWNECARLIGGWTLQGALTAQFVSCVHGNLKTLQPALEVEPPSGRINLLNGIWDVATARLLPSGPDQWSSPVQIPASWTPAAQCPAWDLFLTAVLPADAIDYIWELIGTCMVRDNFDQKLIWLAGEGGNGKGTLLHAITRLIGPRNVASLSFKQIAEDRFAGAQLYGRLLVIDPDSSLAEIKSPESVKKLTGHDQIYAQEKFRRGFWFSTFCKVFVAANGLPISSDISKGFIDRPMIVPMTASIRGTDRERNQAELLAELAAEAPGALNKALAGLGRVWRRRAFSSPESIRSVTSTYKSDAHPMNEFATAYLSLEEGAEVLEPDLRAAQHAWAEQHGAHKLSREAIATWLKTHMPEVKITRPGPVGTLRLRRYVGINLLSLL